MKRVFLIGLAALMLLAAQADVARKGSFNLTVGEDQEEISLAGGKDPEYPTTPGKKGAFDITELDGKGGE